MGLPLYDVSVRTSVVAVNGAIIQLVPPAVAIGSAVTARLVRLRQVAISNTTATGFAVGLGIATAAAVTPATAGVIVRRLNLPGAQQDPVSGASVFSTFGTTPTAPSGFSARMYVPGNSMVVWVFNEGEELTVPPAATPLPFCIWNTVTGQIADVTLTWEE